MDICVRQWDLNRNKVAARYFSSAFLGHTTTKDLYDGFTTVLNNDILSKCNGKEVKIGIATSLLLAKIKVSETYKSQFHDDGSKFYMGIVIQLRERSPLQYKLTRAVSALNPVII